MSVDAYLDEWQKGAYDYQAGVMKSPKADPERRAYLDGREAMVRARHRLND